MRVNPRRVARGTAQNRGMRVPYHTSGRTGISDPGQAPELMG